MSSDQPRRRESSGSPGSPMGSTAAIIIAIVAVVAGFLILRQIGDDDDDGGSLTGDTTASQTTLTPDTGSTLTPVITDPPTTVTTIFTPTTEGATAVVANASTVNGAAGQLTTALSGKGFTMGPATNAGPNQDVSTVLYNATDPDALAVAQSIAVLMGNIEVLELGTPPPTEDGTLADGVSIIVMLGNDKANQTLEAMGTPGTTVPGTTVAPDTATATTG